MPSIVPATSCCNVPFASALASFQVLANYRASSITLSLIAKTIPSFQHCPRSPFLAFTSSPFPIQDPPFKFKFVQFDLH
jgi:hypothetical protein